MSLSKERQLYHLTPNGWVEGAFRGDAIGGKTEITSPTDTVLTIACYDELPSAHSQSIFYDQVVWECEDSELLNELKAKYGDRPNWFGYTK